MPTQQESMGKGLFPLWRSMIPLSSLKRFWSEQQSHTFLINSLIHSERRDWSCFFDFSPGKNHSQHNSPLNGPCQTRTSAAGSSRWGASPNPGESPVHPTGFIWVLPFLQRKSLPALASLLLHRSLTRLLFTLQIMWFQIQLERFPSFSSRNISIPRSPLGLP